MSQQPGQEPLVGEVRFRVPLPFVIPVIALALIALATIAFSRILLNVESETAVIIATAVSLNLLGAAAFIALRPKVATTTYMELLAIVAYPILIGVVIASVGIGEGAGHGAHGGGGNGHGGGGGGNGGGGAGLEITAVNIAFDKAELTLPAGEATQLVFHNEDAGTDHNVAIYPDQAAGLEEADHLFHGEIFPGVETVTYEIPALEAGEYWFQCDVHKNMAGTTLVQ